MAIKQAMFRFVSTRRCERVILSRINNRLIRDRRPVTSASLLAVLFGPGDFADKLRKADAFAQTQDFLSADDLAVIAIEPAVEFFRERLTPGVTLSHLAADFAAQLPLMAVLIAATPPQDVLESTVRMLARLWDSMYAQTTRGCAYYVSTNYLADGLRLYHVLRLIWISHKVGFEKWHGRRFDDYEVFIDLNAARSVPASDKDAPGAMKPAATKLAASLGSFRTELKVGEIRPPAVGDLILVEQELRRYELGELHEIESIMRGERRERTIRELARTTQTSTTETFSEQEESSSLKTDERFQLSSQAQKTATKSFGVQAGVNVSGKFGPVQVSASVNASYNTSESTTQTTAQEYAKTVTEEASRRVRNSIKESSSITILTETQNTSLRGFNNEAGTVHVNGLYRWVDKIYTARLMNYGRRLMLSLTVPEPAAFYRGLLTQSEAEVLEDLQEPLHPSRIGRVLLDPLPESNTTGGFRSHEDITEENYAKLAALYDVTGLQPPPPEFITGSKAIVYPEAMQAVELKEHDHKNDLSYATADNTLTVDPAYRITQIGVFAPTGDVGGHKWYADALKIGEDKDKANLLLVQVGNASFYFAATGRGNDPKKIETNFNSMQAIANESMLFGDVVQPSLPITVTANFEGMLTLTVVYGAHRRDETLDAWKAQTYAAIIKGYTAKKQAYDQARAVLEAKAQSATQAQTFQLREDQYRSIELTELKRGCIDLLTQGTAAGYTSIAIAADGTPRIVYDETEGSLLGNWRSPLSNGAVAEFFEQAFEWSQTTYQFYPYYWAGAERWKEIARTAGADPIFEQFLRAGSASVIVPVRPGYERSTILFLKTGRIWAGGYLPLFNSPEMLDAYSDVELGRQIDPPEQIGESWEIRVPTSMVMLQESDQLPEFPVEEEAVAEESTEPEPEVDETVPY